MWDFRFLFVWLVFPLEYLSIYTKVTCYQLGNHIFVLGIFSQLCNVQVVLNEFLPLNMTQVLVTPPVSVHTRDTTEHLRADTIQKHR